MKVFFVKRKSQSLLETIVAISILIVGVVSMLGMVSAMVVARTTAEYETVATNLAREGIEVVRNVRDTNWMNNVAFDTGLFTQSRYCLSFEPSNTDGFHPNGWRLGTATLNSTLTVMKYTAGPYSGFYTQVCTGETAKWTVAATIYTRTLTIQDICSDGSVKAAGTSCTAGTSVGALITSLVNWTERSRPHSISLVEKIYDWR
jgi:Tfp pilus assembly protein PilV